MNEYDVMLKKLDDQLITVQEFADFSLTYIAGLDLDVKKDGKNRASFEDDKVAYAVKAEGDGEDFVVMEVRDQRDRVKGEIAFNDGQLRFQQTSDARLRDDLRDFSGLNIIRQLNAYKFREKDSEKEPDDPSRRVIHGLIAQEVASIYPQAVVEGDPLYDPDSRKNRKRRPWMIDYSQLVPVLVNCSNDLNKKIRDLKKIVDEQTDKIAIIEQTLIDLEGGLST